MNHNRRNWLNRLKKNLRFYSLKDITKKNFKNQGTERKYLQKN